MRRPVTVTQNVLKNSKRVRPGRVLGIGNLILKRLIGNFWQKFNIQLNVEYHF